MGNSAGRYNGYSASQCENCIRCLHWGALDGIGWTCEAFPEGIPVAIVKGKRSHEDNVPGDNGIHYDARSYKDEEGAYHYTFDNLIVEDDV